MTIMARFEDDKPDRVASAWLACDICGVYIVDYYDGCEKKYNPCLCTKCGSAKDNLQRELTCFKLTFKGVLKIQIIDLMFFNYTGRPNRLISVKEIKFIFDLDYNSLTKASKELYDFPKPYRISTRKIAWRSDHIVQWVEDKLDAFAEIAEAGMDITDDEYEFMGFCYKVLFAQNADLSKITGWDSTSRIDLGKVKAYGKYIE